MPARAFSHSAWRSALATGVASAALLAYGARPVRAQAVTPPAPPCNQISGITGSIITCSGDLSGGVNLPNAAGPYEVLNVNNLTTNITPVSGVDGISFTSSGAVELNINAAPFSIITTGNDADGVFAASNGGPVIVRSIANIATSGISAHGIRAGTFGTSGTDDGAITIRSFGNIAVTGDNSRGIDADSIYGPIDITSFGNLAVSGVGSLAINAETNGDVTITSIGDIATLGEMPDPLSSPNPIGAINAVSVTGDVDITAIGNIATAGDYAVAIAAVAGLDAHVAAFGSISTLGFSAAGISVTADTSTVDSRANIFTQGIMAPGIVVEVTGDATIISRGNITTTGVGADGILAISDGTASVTNYGNITAAAYGISAQGDAGNTVVNFGNIQGCTCAGVDLLSTAVNQLTNFGAIVAIPGGNAIQSDGSDNQVENFGMVTGSVVFLNGIPPGTGTFTNHAGALFNSGAIVMAGLVTNDGTLDPGGAGVVLSTSLGDSFVQNAGGFFAIDVDGAGGTSDQLLVSSTAELAGKVAVTMTSVPLTTAQSYLILQALGGVTNNGLGLIASPALNATLTFPNSNDVVLGISVDFGVEGLNLNPNQKAIGENLDQIFRAGVGGVGPVLLGLLNVDSIDEFKNALDQLSPELYSDAEIAALYSTLAFSGSLLSCKVNGTDTASIIREGQCLWAGASAVFLDAGTTSDQIGYTETAGLFTAGAQVALDNVWRLGAAAGYQNSTLQMATGAQSEGALGQGGVALKYNPGPLLVAGTVSGGGAQYDTRRVMSFGGFTGVAEGTQDLGFVNGGMRVAYVFGDPHLYFKPILDANLTHLQLGGFTESGGNGAALTVDGGGQTVFTLAPTLEAGTEWWLANGTLVRPLLRAGGIWYSNDDLALTASFESAPAGVGPFTINTKFDQVMGLIGAGLDVINGGDAALRLSYDGQLGETTQIHSVGIKGSAKF